MTAVRRRPGGGPDRPVRWLRLAATLVHASPRSWRERYGDELLAWVEEGGFGPMAAFDLALLAFQAHDSPGPNAHMSGSAGFCAWSATTLLAVVLGVAAAATAVRRAQLGLGLLRFAAIGTTVVAGAMVVMLIAIVGWGFALRSADPALFNRHEGIRSGGTAGTWLAIVVVMAAASAVAVRSSARGLARDPGATDPA